MTSNTKTDKFLQLYKQLEYDGRRIFFPNAKENESIIGRLISVPQLKPYKEDLDYCRVVRNFLTHNPKVNGTYPIVPSKEMIELLEKCIKIVTNPPDALNYAVQLDNIMTASLEEKVVDVVQKMNESTYTHVPVLKKGKIIGVFSDNTVYSKMCAERTINITNETTIKEFEDYIPFNKHLNEYFEFVPRKTMLFEIQELFHDNMKRHKLLAVVFITENGRRDEEILGMVTPWDLLSKNIITIEKII